MNFAISDEQQQMLESVRRYLSDEYDPAQRRAILASAPGWSAERWRGFADLGLLGLGIPVELGGLGGSALDLLLVGAAFGEALVVEPVIGSAVLASRAIATLGSPAQHATWLPSLVDGSLVSVLAQDFGPAASELTTVRASLEGGHTVLRGRVPVVYHAAAAALLLVPAATGPDARADALFAVPANAAGVALTRCTTVDGQCATDVVFEGVRVGADARLGQDCVEVLAQIADLGLVTLCGEALGALDRALALTVEYTRNRCQFGGPIGRVQELQHRMVDMLTQIEQARSIAYLAAARCDAGPAEQRAAAVSAAKVLISSAARFVGQQAVQLHGGMGVAEDMPISHYFRRLLAVELRFGSADAHLGRFLEHDGATLGI